MRSDATSVADYLAELPNDRRAAIDAVRSVILEHLPDGYAETIRWGMISYEIPLDRYPTTYNGQPLSYLALASQKRHMALYFNALADHEEATEDFRRRFELGGYTLDMGSSCVRFSHLDELPLDVIAETVASTSVDAFIADYETDREDND